MVLPCRPSSQNILSSVVRSRLMDGWRRAAGPSQLPPPLSAVLLSDAALEVKKFSVSKS